MHGIRHVFRDGLRAVEAPVALIDQSGGWSARSVSQSYGSGFSLNIAANRFRAISHEAW